MSQKRRLTHRFFRFLFNYFLFYNSNTWLYFLVFLWLFPSEYIFLHPRMISKILHFNSFFRVDLQALPQDIEARLTNIFLNNRIYFIFSTFNSLYSFIIIFAFKRQPSMQHAVQDYSCCPYIYPPVNLVIFRIDETLRSHISQTASIEVFLSKETNCSRNPEVYYFYLFLLRVY